MNQANIHYTASNIGLGSVLGSQAQAEYQKQMAMAAGPNVFQPDTVRSLIERAHHAIEVLEQELGRLVDFTYPVREPMPCTPEDCASKTAPSAEAEVIGSLRILLVRIDSQTRTVRQIAEELRI
ncbi:hypothetical protein [Burkholderia pseudomallei]|uniref:hypothetical protein n=1 Tax=Burkholderia pseudomallei TaxID=28450 RepID=UPI000537EE27|nr:hypothetical protein [Burkholderia pseudomallei]KGW43953.1 hypothetical protein Y597_5826 [Burkholderia pseudomallei MSHR1000]